MSEPSVHEVTVPGRPWLAPLAWLAAMVVVAGIAAAPSLLIAPNHWDSCLFVWQGKRLLAGDLPYLSVWDQKLPVLLWINAAAAATGHAYGALFAIQAVAIGSGGWLISLIARRAVGVAAGVAAGFAYATLGSSLALLDTGNLTETYAAPFVILCVHAMLRYADSGGTSWRWPLASGIALGMAGMLRPPLALIGITLLPLVMATYRAKTLRRTALLAWLGGCLVVPLVAVAWAASKGILGLMVQDCIVHNISYAVGGGTPRWTWAHVGRSIQSIVNETPVGHLAGLVGLFLVMLGGPSRQSAPSERRPLDLGVTAVVWLVAAFASALPSLRFYGHYYYVTLAPLALLSGWAWRELTTRISTLPWRRSAGAWTLATLAALIIVVQIQSDYGKARERQKEAQPVAEMERFLSSHGRPGDTLAIFGWGVEMDLMARLGWPSPSKHPHAIIYPELPGGLERLREWSTEMLRTPPVWLVCSDRQDLVQGKMIPVYGWDARAGQVSRPVVDELGKRFQEVARFPVRQRRARGETEYYLIYRDGQAPPLPH